MMPGEPDPEAGVSVYRDDDGSIAIVFGDEVTAADLAAAFASLPADAWVAGTGTTWFSEREGCQGQDEPDEDHIHPVISVLLEPAELPSDVTS
jgi:hypothetical protein